MNIEMGWASCDSHIALILYMHVFQTQLVQCSLFIPHKGITHLVE